MQLVLPVLMKEQRIRWIRTARIHVKYAAPTDAAAMWTQMALEHDYAIVPVVAQDDVVGVFLPGPTTGTVADAMQPAAGNTVDRDASLIENIERLADVAGLVVLHEGKLDGVVTYADLNRRSARVLLYAFIAELEGRLGALARRAYPDPDTFLARFTDALGESVPKRWAEHKAQGVAIHPVQACDLSHLQRVFKDDPGLYTHLGYTKARDVAELGGLVETRHAVMHPVRSLVTNPEDVRTLMRRIHRMSRLLEITRRDGGEPLEFE